MKPWLILATVALLVFAWMFRYEVVAIGPQRTAVLKLDRWTGRIEWWNEKFKEWERWDASLAEEVRLDLQRMVPKTK